MFLFVYCIFKDEKVNAIGYLNFKTDMVLFKKLCVINILI